MAVPPALTAEEMLNRGLVGAAHAGDLNHMKECAKRLDLGEGLMKTYMKYTGPEGLTSLHYGANGGRTNICKYLIEVVGLDVNMKDKSPFGETVLNYAIVSGNHQTVAYLIRKGANVNLTNSKGYAALHTAARQGPKENLRLLMSNGADMEALSQDGLPLNCAASWGKADALKILLDNNAKPYTETQHLFTPLAGSILAQSQECIHLLLKAGADPDLGGHGVTPLEIAACKDYTEGIKCLLKAGANPNVSNIEGMTPLEVSALHNNHEGVRLLLPKTSPLPSIPDWTLRGIINAVHSEEAKNQREQKKKDHFMESKTRGVEAFKKKFYNNAIFWYSKAIECDEREATGYSNRSLCYARMNEGKYALSDALVSCILKPHWSKAHYRRGVAYEILKKFGKAVEAYTQALKLDPGNEEIATALRNVQER